MTAPDDPQPSWGHNIGAFERHYPNWRITSDAMRYIARRKVDGRPAGPSVSATTLDGLAAEIDAAS